MDPFLRQFFSTVQCPGAASLALFPDILYLSVDSRVLDLMLSMPRVNIRKAYLVVSNTPSFDEETPVPDIQGILEEMITTGIVETQRLPGSVYILADTVQMPVFPTNAHGDRDLTKAKFLPSWIFMKYGGNGSDQEFTSDTPIPSCSIGYFRKNLGEPDEVMLDLFMGHVKIRARKANSYKLSPDWSYLSKRV